MASPVDTTVKYFHSAMIGAPVLSGQANGMIPVLDACLVNGFGLKSVDSLVIAGNVATVNIATGHSAEVGSVVLITGATPTALNGEQKITATTATSASFATTALADQTATGTITFKMAPGGWAKLFAGTNLAAYKSLDVLSNGYVLRVDDTGTGNARVVGYESMADINTGVNPFPTPIQQAGGLYWAKSNTTDTTARPWLMFTDGRMIYFCRDNMNQNGYEMTAFGDFLPTKVGDAFATIINGQATSTNTAATVILNNYWYSQASTTPDAFFFARAYTGLGTSMRAIRNIINPHPAGNTFASGNGYMPYPNGPDGGLYLSPHVLFENPSLHFRGSSPGLLGSPQNLGLATFSTRDTLTGQAAAPGRILKAMNLINGTPGAIFFDITGPWR